MKKYGMNEIRAKYLEFFEERGHLRAPSASLIPHNDKSLLLINSGMAPLKAYFTGAITPPAKRMCSCQKCVRVIDIDSVGDASHCTFFEMLGNFSFGDYFKKEACRWTWEFYTQVMGIPAERLYPSVYFEDDEAYDIWVKDIGVPAERVVRLGREDNFWDNGMGPCGPSSEIYYDWGAEYSCGKPDCKPGCDCYRFIEIGNNVFTQFDNDGHDNYTPLAQKNIDFGGGLERLGCVVQGVVSWFEVDTVAQILAHVCRAANITYRHDETKDLSARIVTDHTRSATMLICDGVLPSNEGRGYVLRRLLRRAARHGRLLGVKQPFLHEIAMTVIEQSEVAYPELRARADFIAQVIATEEESFAKTIDVGLKILRERIDELVQDAQAQLPGEDAFRLYDTYGFPIDLTMELLQEQKMTVDRDRFDALMKEQQQRARDARKNISAWDGDTPELNALPATEFVGYTTLTAKATILLVTNQDGVCEQAGVDTEVSVVLDTTPFYAESGGQIADHGTIATDSGEVAIDNVQKTRDGKFMHSGVVVKGVIQKDACAVATVDADYRAAVKRAHSATHLLQTATRQVLGTHIEQGGSYVAPDTLRFDFTHFTAVTPEQLAQISTLVNNMILQGHEVCVETMPIEEAKSRGAMALFGEKYGDTVRVVQMGDVSMELCGGTHVENTAKIGSFVLTAESSVAAGMRRIEAIVGKVVLDKLNELTRLVHTLAEDFKTSPQELHQRAAQTMANLRTLQRELAKNAESNLRETVFKAIQQARSIGGVTVFTLSLPQVDVKALQAVGDMLKNKEPSLVAVIATADEQKASFLAICGKDAIDAGVKAGDVIKTVTAAIGGSGGGRPDSAMGGAKDVTKIDEALALVAGFVQERVGA